METHTQEKPNELVLLIEQSGLEQDTALSLQEAFAPFKEQASKWLEKAKTLVVTDESQKHEMKEAGVARKALKEIRVSVEKRRKELKEDSLKKGKAIDSVASYLKGLIEPIENYLEEQEKFAERKEAERKAQRKASRTSALAEYGVDATFYDLANMPEDIYQNLFEQTKKAHEDKIEAERKAEEARIEAEKQAEIERKEREAKQARFQERQLELAPLKQFSTFELTLETTEQEYNDAYSAATTALLEHNEKQAQIAEENRKLKEAEDLRQAKERIANGRQKSLSQINVLIELSELIDLSESEYDLLYSNHKSAYDKKQSEAKEAEDKRQAELAEQKRIADEAKLKLKEKEDAEAKEKADEAAKIEAELSKGDKEKFDDFMKDLETLKTKYQFKSKKYKDAYAGGVELINRTINYLISKQ